MERAIEGFADALREHSSEQADVLVFKKRKVMTERNEGAFCSTVMFPYLSEAQWSVRFKCSVSDFAIYHSSRTRVDGFWSVIL